MEITSVGWILFGIGFVPWRIDQRQASKGKGQRRQKWHWLEIQATFWHLRIEQCPQGLHWQFSLPLIARLKSAIWSALRDLIKG